MSQLDTVFDLFADGQDFSILATDPGSLSSAGRTTTLVKGRRVPFNASIAGTEFPGYVTLESARLHRISVINHESRKQGTTSKLVTGIFKPVKMNVEIVVDSEVLTLPNLLRKLAMRNVAIDKQVSDEQFIATLEQLGMRFVSGMNLFWQQFGASQEGITQLVTAFKAAGAVDAMSSMTNPGRIKECYQMPRVNDLDVEGPEVTSFELGRSDRTQSMTGQGYLDLVDASTENFKRIYGLRKEAALMKQQIREKSISEHWSQERTQQANKDASDLVRLSQQWATVWSGAQQRISVDPKDPSIKNALDIYDPTSAPCGRFKLNFNNTEVAIDLWSNSARANTSDNSVKVSAPSSEQAIESQILNWN
ncbi:hypothetical protein [Flavobacterium sp.]|uniref:hypothetical protein n=1 Tax=Flavobacterium sp. TaxID=239 RepID=UPI003BC763ED